MTRKDNNTFFGNIPERIEVTKDILVNKGGKPTTIQQRRKSEPVRGKAQGNRTHYSDKEKMNAVCIFAISGNSRRVAELAKIPEATIRQWKTTEWWNEILTRIHVEEDEELDTKLTKLVNKAVDAVNDRLDDGDWIYNPKLDKLVRKPVSAKELAIVSAISIDKRQLLRGQPTSRVEKISQDERLLKLAEQFKQFSVAKEVVHVIDVEEIEEPVIDEDEWEEDGPTINEMFQE
jgi:hypothetical protein